MDEQDNSEDGLNGKLSKLKFEENILLKIPSLTAFSRERECDFAGSEELILRVPSISRRRNSLLIRPGLSSADTHMLPSRRRSSNEGINHNEMAGEDEIGLSVDPVKIQPSRYTDFLRYERQSDNSHESKYDDSPDILENINEEIFEEQKCFSRSRRFKASLDCCICKLPGVHKNEYLAQGHTCFRCCLIQIILLILHLPALLLAAMKSLISWYKHCKRGSYSTDENEDELDIIETKDFDYFWPPHDLSAGEEVRYRHKVKQVVTEWELKDSGSALELIKHECRLICKSNFERRFGIMLPMLQPHYDELLDFGVELAKLAASSGHPDIVKMLITNTRKEGNLISNRSNVGMSTLHVVIINSQRELLNLILGQFSPEDQYTLLHTHTPTKITRQFAAIDLPLNLAVWMGDEGILEDMIQHGAELCEQDRGGHNAFHTAVLLAVENSELACRMFDKLQKLLQIWVNKSKKFTFFRNMSEQSAYIASMEMLLHAHNCDEYTPLQLAAKLGQHEIMDKILNISNVYKFTNYNLGPKSRVYYDMTEIDPFLMQNESTASVLELAVVRTKDDSIGCLGLAPISRLIEEKCSHYWAYIATNALFHFCFMILYNASTYKMLLPHLIPPNNTEPNEANNSEFIEYKRERFEIGFVDIFIVVMAALYFMYGVVAAFATWNLTGKIKASVIDRIWLTNTLQLQTLILFSSLAIIYIVLKTIQNELEVYALAFSMLTGWLHIILYTRAFNATAFFAIMINKILFTDVLRFLCVIFIIVVGFSMATTALFFALSTRTTMLTDPFVVMVQYLKLAIGISDFNALIEPPYNVASIILYVTFLVIANVLLFNLLIAAMSTTFSQISEQRELLCHKVRISDILVLEQMLPLCLQKRVLSMYKHKLSRLHMPRGTVLEKELFLIQA